MKKHISCVRAAVWILAATVAMSAASAETFDRKSLMTVAQWQRDEQDKLLPLQSYDETIRRGMSFVLDDHLKWFKGPADTLVDEKGKTQNPWDYYSNLQHNGTPFPRSADRFVSYPAFHHAGLSDDRWLLRAVVVRGIPITLSNPLPVASLKRSKTDLTSLTVTA